MTMPTTASRFFAAFRKWTLQTYRPHAIACQYHRDGLRTATNNSGRSYQTTRKLTLENQLGEDRMQAWAEEVRGMTSVRSKATAVHTDPGKQTSPDWADEQEHGESILKNSVRKLLRKVPNSVAVITVRHFDSDLKAYVPMGVAVSSLTSVTLDPPTISFNIKEPSKTLDAIRVAGGRFRVHFPAADSGGAKIVESFCEGNHPDAYHKRHKDLNIRIHWDERVAAGTTFKPLAPQIRHLSVKAAMECRLTHELPVADHVILAARVERVELQGLKHPLLVYVDGEYVRSGQAVGTHGTTTISAPHGK